MTTVEDLMSPATVDLDEEGLALYAAMRDAEDEVTALLMASSAVRRSNAATRLVGRGANSPWCRLRRCAKCMHNGLECSTA